MTYTLKNEHYTASVSDMGAELVSLVSVSGYEFLWQKQKDYWHMQAPFLFPLCGSFKDSSYTYNGTRYPMQLHGFLLSSKFQLIEKNDSSISFLLESDENTRAQYPFDFTVEIKYTLENDNISWTAKITNTGDVEMPYMFGWHPGFNLPTDEEQDNEDYLIDFGDIEELTWCPYIDEQFITDRVLPYHLNSGKYKVNEEEILQNDTMIFTGHKNHVKLFAPGHNFNVEMSWSENLPTFCIWKQETHDAKMICMEPWCLFTEDGINDDNYNKRIMPKLASRESETYSCSFKAKR